MKPGTIDIPSVEFKVCVANDTAIQFDGLDINGKDTKVFDFSQVDGLSLRQAFIFLNPYYANHYMGLYAVIDTSSDKDRKVGKKNYRMLTRLIKHVEDFDLDREISEYFEKELYNSLDEGLLVHDTLANPEEVVNTFASRYRGRDQKFILNRRRKN